MLLLQGDCLELMKKIPDKSVDMILCDLPYGTTRNKWDAIIPFHELWIQYRRITKENAAIVLFSQMPFTVKLAMSNLKDFRYEWIWEKSQGTGHLNANRMPMKVHENILVFYKRLPTYNPHKKSGCKPYRSFSKQKSSNYGSYMPIETVSDGTRFPVDIIHFSNVNCTAEKPIHPTQKPVALCEYLIKTYSNEGETVLDNCMGSGTTGVACANVGREFIGMEKDEQYFQIAKERIENAIKEKEMSVCQ